MWKIFKGLQKNSFVHFALYFFSATLYFSTFELNNYVSLCHMLHVYENKASLHNNYVSLFFIHPGELHTFPITYENTFTKPL